MSSTSSRADVYTRVTESIIVALEQGTRPWLKPWSVEHAAGRITRPLRENGEPYKGINVLLLWAEALDNGYAAPIWMTYKQALSKGANVRKGEHGCTVVYADHIHKQETNDKGEEVDRAIPFLRAYTVFNVEQIEKLPEEYYAKPVAPLPLTTRIEHTDKWIEATGANIQHGGNRACYSVATDKIRMPPFEAFRDPESYYATKLHELTHWTRHPSRLDRDFGRKQWGDEGYAREELVAELGAAFLCADLGIAAEPRDDHAEYIASWLEVLKREKRFVFTAASHAQRAADYLHGLQPAPAAAADMLAA